MEEKEEKEETGGGIFLYGFMGGLWLGRCGFVALWLWLFSELN